jgi:hypothetical protein
VFSSCDDLADHVERGVEVAGAMKVWQRQVGRMLAALSVVCCRGCLQVPMMAALQRVLCGQITHMCGDRCCRRWPVAIGGQHARRSAGLYPAGVHMARTSTSVGVLSERDRGFT